MLSRKPQTHKKCPKCGEILSREMFSLRKSGSLQSYCKRCSSKTGRAWASENREKATQTSREWRASRKENGMPIRGEPSQAEKDAQSKRNKKRYWSDPEKARAARRVYYAENKELEAKKYKDWAAQNRSKRTSAQVYRDAAKKKATPSWANSDDISRVYSVCERVTKRTGVPHHVDHIVPLVSDVVCGLHVFNNLAVVTAKENQSKSNRKWPGMFDG